MSFHLRSRGTITCARVGCWFSWNHFWRSGISFSGSKQTRIRGRSGSAAPQPNRVLLVLPSKLVALQAGQPIPRPTLKRLPAPPPEGNGSCRPDNNINSGLPSGGGVVSGGPVAVLKGGVMVQESGGTPPVPALMRQRLSSASISACPDSFARMSSRASQPGLWGKFVIFRAASDGEATKLGSEFACVFRLSAIAGFFPVHVSAVFSTLGKNMPTGPSDGFDISGYRLTSPEDEMKSSVV